MCNAKADFHQRRSFFWWGGVIFKGMDNFNQFALVMTDIGFTRTLVHYVVVPTPDFYW